MPIPQASSEPIDAKVFKAALDLAIEMLPRDRRTPKAKALLKERIIDAAVQGETSPTRLISAALVASAREPRPRYLKLVKT